MAWADAYATAQEYRDRQAKTITATDPIVLAQLTAISRMVEQECGDKGIPRVFNQSNAGEARYFDLGEPISDDDPGSKYLVTPRRYGAPGGLDIDDLVTMTELASDLDGNGTWETVAAAGDTYLRPYNAVIYGRPYTRIELAYLATTMVGGGAKAVRITGTWGWPSVPLPIKEAVIELAGILRIENSRAKSTVQEMGVVIGMSKEGAGIIERLKKHYKRNRMSF